MKKLITLLAFSLIAVSSFGATRYWIGASGTSWSASTSWNTAADGSGTSGAPTSTDDAIIDGDNVTIVIDGTITLNSFIINSNSTVIFTVTATATRNFTTNNGAATTPQFSIGVGRNGL